MTTQAQTLSTPAPFGQLLRRWRRDRGLSQRDFGELLDPKVRHSTVSCWETDVRCPSLVFLRQIVAITGIPADLALGIDGACQEDDQP
jgi:transcriptional regulator with XRE-family HTH domain